MSVLSLSFSSAMLKGMETWGKETKVIEEKKSDAMTPLLDSQRENNSNNYRNRNNSSNRNISGDNMHNDNNDDQNNKGNNNVNIDNYDSHRNIENNNHTNNNDSNNNNNTRSSMRSNYQTVNDNGGSQELKIQDDGDEKPALQIPYLILSVLFLAWVLYAILYVSLGACVRCSWTYILLFTLYVIKIFENVPLRGLSINF